MHIKILKAEFRKEMPRRNTGHQLLFNGSPQKRDLISAFENEAITIAVVLHALWQNRFYIIVMMLIADGVMVLVR